MLTKGLGHFLQKLPVLQRPLEGNNPTGDEEQKSKLKSMSLHCNAQRPEFIFSPALLCIIHTIVIHPKLITLINTGSYSTWLKIKQNRNTVADSRTYTLSRNTADE